MANTKRQVGLKVGKRETFPHLWGGICIHQNQEFLLCCKEAAQSGKKHFPAPVLEICNIIQMHSMEDCMEAPLMVLKI